VNEPLPRIHDRSGRDAFLQAGASGEFTVQRCTDCGSVRWPVRPTCPECLGATWEMEAVDLRGTVVTSATYRRAVHPSLTDEVPYVVVYVQLDAGPRIIGRVEPDAADPAIGTEVIGALTTLDNGSLRLTFRPA
jgi:uncharacterized OB-fold protein